MDFRLKDARPIWQQLGEILTEGIVTGEYPPGGRFPSVRELAAQAGVNPNTMQRALSQLETADLLVTNRTAGRQVTEDAAVLETTRRSLAEARVADFLEAMEKLGYGPEEAAGLAARGKKEGSHE